MQERQYQGAADKSVEQIADRETPARRIAAAAASSNGLMALPRLAPSTRASAAVGDTKCE